MPTTLARTFAALSAINEAILYAKSPDELYQKVCDAGFSSGNFLAVAVFLVGPDGRFPDTGPTAQTQLRRVEDGNTLQFVEVAR